MKENIDKRPKLNKEISIQDFREFYWLKSELLDFCKEEGLPRTGGKIEIAKRIEHYLQTGEIEVKKENKKPKKSKFDWNTEKLTLSTIITDNYKNTENVRQYFESKIGLRFKFNVKFMNWMKSNEGKTFAEAIETWKRLDEEKNTNKKAKEIAPQFEYNTYLRDFSADNPDKNRATGIELWKIKRSMRGDNVYRKSDLELLNHG